MALLSCDNLEVRFGGLVALSRFSFSIDPGELVALIGPNGAGKTTAFNLVTGVYAPTSGTIELSGERIDGLAPAAINRRGIARTFQNIRLFRNLTAIQNVAVALHHSTREGLLSAFVHGPKFERQLRSLDSEATELLDILGLASCARVAAASLSYGDQRRLEIARALATHPRILLLDEPAAGMNPEEKLQLMDLIRMIRDRFHVGVWLIEHDMNLVMSISQRITVLDHGETIAVGTPTEIQANAKVIEAYLGQPVPS
jgi:branched-chain amino acid transport system ATP-binding protein